jgi:hypothetical protein
MRNVKGQFAKGFTTWNKGIPMSEETKRKDRESHLGKRVSKETKQKLSKSHKGINIWMKGRALPQSWKINIGKGQAGNLHWNWQGGISPEHDKVRRSIPYREWQKAVSKYYKYTCQKCLVKYNKIQCHHILNFKNHIELRFDVNNGINLCKRCHDNFHARYGNKNNTREQLEEFLNSLSINIVN